MQKSSICAILVGLGLLLGCSEPVSRVTRSTSDGSFSVALVAERNWVYPSHSLPVKVVVESLTGPVLEPTIGRVDLVVNNGTVSPAFVQVTLAGPGFDGSPADTRFVAWVTFRANTGQTVDSRGNVTGLSSAHQGEIHALFGDVMATIKIRIADPPNAP